MDGTWIETASQYGLLGLVLLVVFVGLGWFGKAVYNRLFDEERGLFTLVTRRHIEYVDSNAEVSKNMLAVMENQEAHTKELVRLHDDPNSTFSTVKTNRALWHLAEAIKFLGADDIGRCQEHVEQAKEALAMRNGG